MASTNTRDGTVLPYLLEKMWCGCCAPWPFAKDDFGYAKLRYNGRLRRAHEVVCEFVYGEKQSSEHHVRHKCGKGHLGCFSAQCVIWGTRSENMRDSVKHNGLHGEGSHLAKLKKTDVIYIREMKGKIKQRDIAALFGVSQANISLIQSNKNWQYD